MKNIFFIFLGLPSVRAKICGVSFGQFGHEKAEILLKNAESCEFQIHPEGTGKVKFSDMKLNIDGITEIDDFYFTPRCDMMQIYIKDQNGFQGPYCDNSGRIVAESFQKKESEITRLLSRSARSLKGHERSKRVRRGVKSMEELKETEFQGDEIDLVFVKDHNSYRFTFGFEFTWELLNTEVTNKTECTARDIPVLTNQPMREMKFSNEIIQDWETLTYSIAEFGKNFDQYNEYCNGNATNIDCIQVGTSDTPESMLLKLEYTLNQILSNCVQGFGHLWMDHFTNLQNMMTQTDDWKPMNLTQRFSAMQHHTQQSHMKDALHEMIFQPSQLANMAATVTVEADFDSLDEKRKNKKPTRQPKTLAMVESTISDDDYEHDVIITTVDTRDPSIFGAMTSTAPSMTSSTTMTTIQVTRPSKNKGGKFKGEKPGKTEKPKKDKKDKKKSKKSKEEITTTVEKMTTTVTTTKLTSTLASTLMSTFLSSLTTSTKKEEEGVYVEIDTGAGYSPYGIVLAPDVQPEVVPEVVPETKPEAESETKPEVSLSVTGGVCPWMNQESGECKIDYIQHCNLAAFERAVKGNCGAITAVDTMVKIMNVLVESAHNTHGRCEIKKPSLPCSVLVLDGINEHKNYKPLVFIKKIRNIAHKVLSGCENDLRVETGQMFRKMWTQLKCNRNNGGGGDRMMGQRSHMDTSGSSMDSYFEFISEDAEDFGEDYFFEKNKTMCNFNKYEDRNVKVFNARIGLAMDPDLSTEIYSELARIVSNLGRGQIEGCNMRRIIPQGSLQIPCDLIYVSKNEQACQISLRLERLFHHLSQACDPQVRDRVYVLLGRLIDSSSPEDVECPPIGINMVGDTRRIALEDRR